MQYAVIDGGVVVNVTICDDQDFAAQQGWVALDEGYWIGDLWSADSGYTKKQD